MRRLLVLPLVLLACVAQAQTLRWAAQGDLQSTDPHAANEVQTNSLNGQVYEPLIQRLPDQTLAPALAVEWTQATPLLWRVKLRPGVKFHDGTPFTADDVVFSLQRMRDPVSPYRVYASAVGMPKAVDPLTLVFVLDKPNPIFAEHLVSLRIMSKRWAEANRVTRPLDLKAKEDLNP